MSWRVRRPFEVKCFDLSEALDIPSRHRRRIERWKRKNPDKAAVAVYRRYPPYGIHNNAGNRFSFFVTIYQGQRKVKRFSVEYTAPRPRAKIKAMEPGTYRIEADYGELDGILNLAAGDVFEIYARSGRRWAFRSKQHMITNEVFSGFYKAASYDLDP